MLVMLLIILLCILPFGTNKVLNAQQWHSPRSGVEKANEVCILNSLEGKEHIEISDCEEIASHLKLVKSSVFANAASETTPANIHSKTREMAILFQDIKQSTLRQYPTSVLSACLNRQFACKNGYNYFVPASPSLGIVQSGVYPQFDSLHNAHEALFKKCQMEGTVLDIRNTSNTGIGSRRPENWCKVVLMKELASRFRSSCKVIIHIDGQTLLKSAETLSRQNNNQVDGDDGDAFLPMISSFVSSPYTMQVYKDMMSSQFSSTVLLLKNGIKGRQLLSDWLRFCDHAKNQRNRTLFSRKFIDGNFFGSVDGTRDNCFLYEDQVLEEISSPEFKHAINMLPYTNQDWYSQNLTNSNLLSQAMDVWIKEREVSSCLSSNSIPRLRTDRFSLVVSVSETNVNIVQYSLCTWMRDQSDSMDIVIVSDLPRQRIQVECDIGRPAQFQYVYSNFVSNYMATSTALYEAYTSKAVKLHDFILWTQPFTLVHPKHTLEIINKLYALSQYVSSNNQFLLGHITDAVSDLSSMGMLPRPAWEFGILLNLPTLRLVAHSPICIPAPDFRSVESGVSIFAACAFDRSASPDLKRDVLPDLNDVFIAARGHGHEMTSKQLNSYVTFGPLDQFEMSKIIAHNKKRRKSSSNFPKQHASTSSSSKVLFAVLVRESTSLSSMSAVLSSWGQDANIMFFVDYTTYKYIDTAFNFMSREWLSSESDLKRHLRLQKVKSSTPAKQVHGLITKMPSIAQIKQPSSSKQELNNTIASLEGVLEETTSKRRRLKSKRPKMSFAGGVASPIRAASFHPRSAVECWHEAIKLSSNLEEGAKLSTLERGSEAEKLFSLCLKPQTGSVTTTPPLSSPSPAAEVGKGEEESIHSSTSGESSRSDVSNSWYIVGPNSAELPGRVVHLVGLGLPAMPRASSSFYGHSLRKDISWDMWLRAKVHATIDVCLNSVEAQAFDWFVMMDDDTYIIPHKLESFLRTNWPLKHLEPIAMGREFTRVNRNGTIGDKLIGGGPGILFSKAAIESIRKYGCTLEEFPIISEAVPGGDGWLGQCFAKSHVHLVHDWRFKSLPPVAFSPDILPHVISFHKVKTESMQEVHSFLQKWALVPGTQHWPNASTQFNLSSSCIPTLPRGASRPLCAPNFVIIGAQKAATTSLFGYINQHPQAQLPKEKEQNFFGWAFPRPSYSPGNEAFIFRYLRKFPSAHTEAGVVVTGDNSSLESVSGEASPDYFVAGTHAVVNILRFLPRVKIIVSLREPIDRAISAYKNKLNDGTVRKMLNPIMWGANKADPRLDSEVSNYVVPSFHELVRHVNFSFHKCPQRLHFTMNDRPPHPETACLDSFSKTVMVGNLCRSVCYVNPFVLHGYYAKYLAIWLRHLGEDLLVVDYKKLDSRPSEVMTTVAKFLNLDTSFTFNTNLVMNSRNNRGVHSASSNAKVGGVISAIVKEKDLSFSWKENLHVYAAYILQEYYREPNKELQELLKFNDQELMSWIDPTTGLDYGEEPIEIVSNSIPKTWNWNMTKDPF